MIGLKFDFHWVEGGAFFKYHPACGVFWDIVRQAVARLFPPPLYQSYSLSKPF
jgi:hypothetical protein